MIASLDEFPISINQVLDQIPSKILQGPREEFISANQHSSLSDNAIEVCPPRPPNLPHSISGFVSSKVTKREREGRSTVRNEVACCHRSVSRDGAKRAKPAG